MRPGCFSAAVIGMRRASLLLGIPLLAAAAALAAPPDKLRNHFDSDTMNTPPAFFDFPVLGAPGEAHWIVTAAGFGDPRVNTSGFNSPSMPNYVLQIMPSRPADSIAAAVRRNSVFEDGTWSVAIRKLQGTGG